MTGTSVRDNAIVAAACGLGLFLMARAWNGLRATRALVRQIQDLQAGGAAIPCDGERVAAGRQRAASLQGTPCQEASTQLLGASARRPTLAAGGAGA
jgi:hypothetical protein